MDICGKGDVFSTNHTCTPLLQEQLKEASIQLLDICDKGDQVAAVRCASVTTKAGTTQPAILVIDVWHVAGGQVGSACAVLCHAVL